MSNSNSPLFTWRGAVCDCQSLKSTTRHVLLTIATHMNGRGEGSYPTVAQLMYETGLSNRTVCTHIQLAAEAGWIRIKKHGFAGQRWANHEYEPDVPKDHKRTTFVQSKKGSEPNALQDKVVNLTQEGSEPNDTKAVKEVHSSSSVSSSVGKRKEEDLSPTPATPKKPNPRILPGAMTECDGECDYDYPRSMCQSCKTKRKDAETFGRNMLKNFTQSKLWGTYFDCPRSGTLAKNWFNFDPPFTSREVATELDHMISDGKFSEKKLTPLSTAIELAATNLGIRS